MPPKDAADKDKEYEGLKRDDDDHSLQYILALKETFDWSQPGQVAQMADTILGALMDRKDGAKGDMAFANNQTSSKVVERLLGTIGYVLHTSIYAAADARTDAALMCPNKAPEEISAGDWAECGPGVWRSERDRSLPAGYIKERLREGSDLIVADETRDGMVSAFKKVFQTMLLATEEEEFIQLMEGRYSSWTIQELLDISPVVMSCEALAYDPEAPPLGEEPPKKKRKTEKPKDRKSKKASPSAMELVVKFYERVEEVYSIRDAILGMRKGKDAAPGVSNVCRSLMQVLGGYHPFQGAVEKMENQRSATGFGNRKKDVKKKASKKKNALVDALPEERFIIWHPMLRTAFLKAMSALKAKEPEKGAMSRYFSATLGPPAFNFILDLLNDKEEDSEERAAFVRNCLALRKKSKDKQQWGSELDGFLKENSRAYFTLEHCVSNADGSTLRDLISAYFEMNGRLTWHAHDPRGNYVIQALFNACATVDWPEEETASRAAFFKAQLSTFTPSLKEMMLGDYSNVVICLINAVNITKDFALQREMMEQICIVLKLNVKGAGKKLSQNLCWLSLLAIMPQPDLERHLDDGQVRLMTPPEEREEEEGEKDHIVEARRKNVNIVLKKDERWSKEFLSVPFSPGGMNLVTALLKYPKSVNGFIADSLQYFTKWKTVVDQIGRDPSGTHFLETLLTDRTITALLPDQKGKNNNRIDKLIRCVGDLVGGGSTQDGWWNHPRASFVVGAAFNRCENDAEGLKMKVEMIQSLIPVHTKDCRGPKHGCTQGCEEMRSRPAEVQRRNKRLYELFNVSLWRNDKKEWKDSWAKLDKLDKDLDFD